MIIYVNYNILIKLYDSVRENGITKGEWVPQIPPARVLEAPLEICGVKMKRSK